MATTVYGASDDLIEFEGDIDDEINCYECAAKLKFSDGTVLSFNLGKPEGSIWAIEVIEKGSLLERIDICDDEDDAIYSDMARFRDGLTGFVLVGSEGDR